MNRFTKCEKQLIPQDIREVENKLSLKLPKELKSHYLKSNGGVPDKKCWWQDDYIYFEVVKFRPIKYVNGEINDDNFKTLESTYLSRTAQKVIPKNYLPFAYDLGNNYFCLNTDTNDVYIVFMDLGNPMENPDSFRKLTNGFQNFIDNLEEGEEDI